jgi:Protein of unknown function (DUF3467)
MPSPLHTVYANIVNVTITKNELIFEFGAQFPPTGSQGGKPSEFTPEVRVVLGPAALKQFADLLNNAVTQVEGATAPQQNQPHGDRPTPKQ